MPTPPRPRDAVADGQLQPGASKLDRMRFRASWMYYVEQMTQNDIALALGIGRVTVVRLLAEARMRNEVQISVTGGLAELTELERALEARFGLDRAIVAPLSVPAADPAPVISKAIGNYLSETVQSGMTVGLGWGRTLLESLPHVQAPSVGDLRVISLLGGISHAHTFNPSEFSWRFAQIFKGDAYLLAAPAIVDSTATKTALIDRCGLDVVMQMADDIDLLVVSVGSIQRDATTFRTGYIGEARRQALKKAGAVGDLLFHFMDAEGEIVDPALDERVMSVRIEQMRAARMRVLASGGPDKDLVLRAAMRFLSPTVFITDEQTAQRLLQEA